MMLIGLTATLNKALNTGIMKKKGAAMISFSLCFFLPLLTCFLFFSGILKGRPMFSGQIQEPVAKIITPKGVGTAFLISPTKLLTARHVVMDINSPVQVIFEKAQQPRTVEGKVKYVGQTTASTSGNGIVPIEYFLTDLAVIEIPAVDDIVPLDLGESEAVSTLDEVILIGYPAGDYSITKGNINSDTYQGQNLFKLDASSNPGNSGGPCILENDNTVIGILVGDASAASQGENIALKASAIKALLKSAKINL